MLVFMAVSMTGDATRMFTVIADFAVEALRIPVAGEDDDP
jgi:hypothetical protein